MQRCRIQGMVELAICTTGACCMTSRLLHETVLPIIPRTFFWLLDDASWHCYDGFKSAVICTTKSTVPISVNSLKYLSTHVVHTIRLPKCITLHLAVLNGICHVFIQFMSWCKRSLSLRSLVSSANLKTVLTKPASRSLMNIRNRIGPSREPWGWAHHHWLPCGVAVYSTRYLLPFNHSRIQSKSPPQYRGTTGLRPLTSAILASYSPPLLTLWRHPMTS